MSGSDQAFIKAYGVGHSAVETELQRLPPVVEEAPGRQPEPRLHAAHETIMRLPSVDEASIQSHIGFQLPGQVRLAGAAGAAAWPAVHQPLSSFTQQPAPLDAAEPAFEVESFRWPRQCDQLAAGAGAAFAEMGRQLLADNSAESRVIAMGGVQRGEGRSTALLCIARQLALAGVKTAVVDAHFANPAMAIALGLAVEIGWEAVIGGEFPLSDALIFSKNDLLTLLPLKQPVSDPKSLARSLQIAVTIAMLRETYDRVLVDIGPVAQRDAVGLALLGNIGASGVLLVRDARKTLTSNFDAALGHVRGTGARLLGVAETFVREIGETSRRDHRRASAA